MFITLDDHLGSSTTVIDRASGELVERSTYQVYGGSDSDFRPDKWRGFREDYRFTGKEEDTEVGLTYFGKRYYNPLLQRWVSPDPLEIHKPGEADANLYGYVRGMALKAVDPLGLEVYVHHSLDKTDAPATNQGPDRRAEVVQALQTLTEDELGVREVGGTNGRHGYHVFVKKRHECQDDCKLGTTLTRSLLESTTKIVLTRSALGGANPGEHRPDIKVTREGKQLLKGLVIRLDTEKLANKRIETLEIGKNGTTQWVKETLGQTVQHELVHAYRLLNAVRIWDKKDVVTEHVRLPTGKQVSARTSREEVETTGLRPWKRGRPEVRTITENSILREQGRKPRAGYSVHRFEGQIYLEGKPYNP